MTIRRLTSPVTAAAGVAAALLLASAAPASASSVFAIGAGFETDMAPFTAHIETGMPGDSAWKQVTSAAHSGTGAAFGPSQAHVTDNRLTSSDSLHVAAGNTTAKLSFFHSYNFEAGFDGGVLERSLDGGPFADFAPGDFLMGGPTTTLSSSFGNPLGGHVAWSGASGPGAQPPFIHTVVDLSPYAGHDVTLRFRLGTDSSTSGSGWWVDDVDAGLAPGAATGAASGITATGADIAGVVTPHSTSTSFHVEYGTTTAYGTLAPAGGAPVGNDTGPDSVSQALTGLAPETTYHYRVVATWANGNTPGGDATFETTAVPPAPLPAGSDPGPPVDPGPPPPGPPPVTTPPAFAGVGLQTASVRVKAARRVKLRISCPAAAVGDCVGADVLTTAGKVRRAGKKARVLKLGRSVFSIAPGSAHTVTIKLPAAAAKLLAAAPKHALKARQAALASDSRGVSVTTVKKVTVRRAAR